MNKEHTNYLFTKYPTLYQQHTLPMQETCMCWGFECGDGWFSIIDNLSKRINEIDPDVEAVQVKEKFGGLRFYIGPVAKATADKVYDAISKAENLAYKTCEYCGSTKNVKQTTTGWIKTLCKECRKEK